MKKRIFYYGDELNDNFAGDNIKAKKIDSSYVYDRTSIWGRAAHFFWYRVVAVPTAFLYMKLFFHHKTVNKEVLKPYSKTGYFIYGNHTHNYADPCVPNLLSLPKESHIVVHPNNVSMPLLGRITPYLGALPLPDDMDAYGNFAQAMKKRIEKGQAVVIYPEATIWPYYTGIRPFADTSFHYPIKYNAPVFCFTNTYQKRRFGKRPKMVTYVDGPFFQNEDLPLRQRKKDLRDRVYTCMCERAKLSEVSYVRYVKREEKND